MLWHGRTSRLIGSGISDRPSDQVRAKMAIVYSVAGSMTTQPPGIRPSALRVATHDQQVASLGWRSYPSAEVQSAYFTAPGDRASNPARAKEIVNIHIYVCMLIFFYFRWSKEKKKNREKYFKMNRSTKRIIFF